MLLGSYSFFFAIWNIIPSATQRLNSAKNQRLFCPQYAKLWTSYHVCHYQIIVGIIQDKEWRAWRSCKSPPINQLEVLKKCKGLLLKNCQMHIRWALVVIGSAEGIHRTQNGQSTSNYIEYHQSNPSYFVLFFTIILMPIQYTAIG